jgi:perosamine synthetase
MTTAEGGAVYSKDAKLIRKIADLRDYDHKNDYKLRFNYKMTDIAAALGLTQLSKLNSFIAKRKEIAAAYNKKFSKCTFELPAMEKGKDHIYFRYIIKTKNKTALMKKLKDKGIGCAAPVYKPLHRYLNKKRFPAADNLICEAISIPIYPMLSQKQIQYISETIQNLMPRKTRRS